MFLTDLAKLIPLLEQFVVAAEKRVVAAEQKAEAAFAAFQATKVGADFDAQVKAALNDLLPGLDLSTLEKAISSFGSSTSAAALVTGLGAAAQIGGAITTAVTGVDVSGIVTAITAATGVASDIVHATVQAHADALEGGATVGAATAAGKDAALSAGAAPSPATALSSVVATTVQVQQSTGAPVAQVAAAAVAHDDNTDDAGKALPGADPIGAAFHAATGAGADESTASTIAHAVAAATPATLTA